LKLNMDEIDPASISRYITDTFDRVEVAEASGDSFFMYLPEHVFDPAHRLPFATIVTSDAYDQFSDLNRPSVFRLNVGVGKETFQSLFGAQPFPSDADEVARSGYDFTALDTLQPHPVYGRMFWVCVLSPSTATFDSVKPFLAEAYELSMKRMSRAAPKQKSTAPPADES
jgi:hypothetical protein